MPKKPHGIIVSLNLRWRLHRRGENGSFYADGRSNAVNGGRHSLETNQLPEARRRLADLDRLVAVERGQIPESPVSDPSEPGPLSLADGRDLYLEHLARPAVTGGTTVRTRRRYAAVFEKFIAFALSRHVTHWHGVTRNILEAYGRWLEDAGYAYRTQTLELTTLKQAMRYMIGEGLLPERSRVHLPLRKATGTPTYCYSKEEVTAIIEHCRRHDGLGWLADVVTALAHTGMRISELADLRWSDLDLEHKVIRLADHSRGGGDSRRTTKTHRDRVLPIHARLLEVLQGHANQQGRVFRGPRGGVLKPDTARVILKRDVLQPLAPRFCSRDGQKGFTDGRLHSFRHFFCSVCADEGIPEQMLMNWLGHANSAMIRHYYHARDGVAQQRLNAVAFTGESR
jgi:integrase